MATTSIRDVAARAGVSVGTVSNVLNHSDKVSPISAARRRRRDRGARLRAQRRGPAAPGRTLDDHRPRRARRAQPVLHRCRPRRRGRGGPALDVRHPRQQRRELRPRGGLPRPVRRAARARRAHLAVRRRRSAAAPAAIARHRRGARRPGERRRVVQLGRGRRHPGWRPRRRAPAQHRTQPDRLRRRSVRDPPGVRPSRGRPPRRRPASGCDAREDRDPRAHRARGSPDRRDARRPVGRRSVRMRCSRRTTWSPWECCRRST